MALTKSILRQLIKTNVPLKYMSQECTNTKVKFKTVFTFPTIRYIAIINRLKVFQIAGTTIAIPSSGILEMASLVSNGTFLTATYVGLTTTALLALATLPFRNIIGFLYISENNKNIKISSVDYWGKRVDRVIEADDWIPLLDLPQKTTDPIYLSPHLTDGSSYKLFIKFGKILDSKKVGQVLE